jgi:hypothetical protein
VSATGTGPISYQWKKGAAPIDGATSSSYTIPSLVEGDEGSYSVVVTNIVGSVNSSAATLSVNDPITITAQPISQTLNPGASATFSVTATGTGPINYQWRKNGLAIATGSTLTIADVSNSDEGEYTVIVSNVVGSVVSSKAVLSVNDPIVITAQPVSTFVHEGGSVSFSVAVSGTEPLSYLWHHDNQPMASVTTPTLTISEAKEADAGSYHCVVTNVVGSVTSNAATLEVRLKPRITRQPESKEVRSKAAVTFSAEASGHAPLSYQWFKDGAELTGQTQAALTLEQVGTAQAGSYTVRVRNEAGEALSAAAQLRLVIWSEVDGTYQGLLVRDNGAAPEQSPYPGRLTVTLTSQGAMSGSLEYAGLTHRFAGKFAPELNYARIFARKGQSSLELKMALDASDLVLSAWVNEVAVAGAAAPQEPSETALALQPFNSRTNPAPQTGRYTMLLRPTADVVEGPQVPGYATVSINSSGAAKITGKLPDGSVVGCSALLAEDGTIGVYEGLYRKVYPYAGHVSGPVRFDPDGGELAVSGSMEWRKPAQETGALWPQGFVTALETEGSFYVPPTRGIRVLDLAAGTDTLDLTLEGPITGDLFTREVRLSTGNKFLIDAPNAEKLSLKLDAKTGIVTGEFFDLGVRKTRKLEGVVLPESNQIEGFFLGGSSSGSILIAPTQ